MSNDLRYEAITEKEWQAQVVEMAGWAGWSHYHTYDSRRSVAGFPDLVLWRPSTGEFLAAELKTEKGRLTAAQSATLADLRECGVEVLVWRPSHVDSVLERLGLDKGIVA